MAFFPFPDETAPFILVLLLLFIYSVLCRCLLMSSPCVGFEFSLLGGGRMGRSARAAEMGTAAVVGTCQGECDRCYVLRFL